MLYKFYILFILSFLISGCDFFATRNPEQPDIGGLSFIPPTEPSVVIVNLENALKSKNIDNYMNCFYSFQDKPKLEFEFIPSTDGFTQYPTLFSGWRISEERRSVTSIFNSINEGQSISINWLNRQPFRETADSAVFTSDYIIYTPNKDLNIPDIYAGRLQFSLTFRENGLWYISRWIDVNVQIADSIKNTWSILKGTYYN